METPPHSRLASAVLAFGGFVLTFFAFGLIIAGTNELRFGSLWHGYYETADGWLFSTAGMSLEDAAWWAFGILAAVIGILFYHALRRSRRAAAGWGYVVGALLVGVLTDFFSASIAINAVAILTVGSGFVVAIRLREPRATTTTRLLVV